MARIRLQESLVRHAGLRRLHSHRRGDKEEDEQRVRAGQRHALDSQRKEAGPNCLTNAGRRGLTLRAVVDEWLRAAFGGVEVSIDAVLGQITRRPISNRSGAFFFQPHFNCLHQGLPPVSTTCPSRGSSLYQSIRAQSCFFSGSRPSQVIMMRRSACFTRPRTISLAMR